MEWKIKSSEVIRTVLNYFNKRLGWTEIEIDIA